LERSDLLLFSAGSSMSTRDMTATVIDSLGSPGVLVHGISLRPGKPTIVGLVDGKPAFGLPGNPVSAMVVFDLLVRPTIYLLAGCAVPPEPPTIQAKLLRDIASLAGREDHVQVRLVRQNGILCADPVFGKSNLIYTLVRADGVVKVPLDRGGLYADELVTVRVY
jgi:molybdopterin molybdotransferase